MEEVTKAAELMTGRKKRLVRTLRHTVTLFEAGPSLTSLTQQQTPDLQRSHVNLR